MEDLLTLLGGGAAKRPRLDTTAMSQLSANAPQAGLSVSDTCDFFSDVVGEESQRGKRMQAGAILDMIDTLAGVIAAKYSCGPVATISFDRVDFIRPILHLDLVRLEGRLISTGNSSMVVEVKGYRQNLHTRSFSPVCVCYVTMVAISPLGIPRKGIPQINYKSEEEIRLRDEANKRKELYNQWNALHDDVDKMENLTTAEVEDSLNRNGKTEFLKISQTEVLVKKMFFPKHVNLNNTIFGGEVLLWMDKVATHTARHFTKNHYMLTISMNRVTFKKPIFVTDVVEMRSRVVYVRNHVLEVEIDVTVQRINGERVPSHSGHFIILNADESGGKLHLSTGLKLEDSDQAGLKSYLKGKERFAFGVKTENRTPGHYHIHHSHHHSSYSYSPSSSTLIPSTPTSSSTPHTSTTPTLSLDAKKDSDKNDNNNNNNKTSA